MNMGLLTGNEFILLLLTTNRKSHMHFRLVPKSSTLDDLELLQVQIFTTQCCYKAQYVSGLFLSSISESLVECVCSSSIFLLNLNNNH